jgi:hypothetical protein
MKAMKFRLLAMGGIISALSLGLLGVRGYSADYVGLLGVGILLFVLGAIWK